MWRNRKFCQIWRNYRCEEIRNLNRGCDFHCFVTEFVLLQFTHMEKSWAKNCVCGKKCQIMRFCLTCFSSKDLEVSLKGGIWSMVTRVQSKPPSTIVCGWSVLQFWRKKLEFLAFSNRRDWDLRGSPFCLPEPEDQRRFRTFGDRCILRSRVTKSYTKKWTNCWQLSKGWLCANLDHLAPKAPIKYTIVCSEPLITLSFEFCSFEREGNAIFLSVHNSSIVVQNSSIGDLVTESLTHSLWLWKSSFIIYEYNHNWPPEGWA